MAAIVKRFVAVAKQGPTEVRSCDVNAILNETLWLLKNDFLRHNIDVTGELQESLPTVSGDPQQLAQVFMNLLTNARQALERVDCKRQVTVTTALHGENGKPLIEIQISDNGPGISPQDLPQIFEPIYTTKLGGKGVGLGLSICHRIITSLGGTIHTESMVGNGASFVIRIPTSKKAQRTQTVPASSRAPSRGNPPCPKFL